jgi:hypothetical protein
MEEYIAYTNRKPANLVVNLSTPRQTKVRIRAIDPSKLGAMYMDREATVNGRKKFEIRLPQSPEKLLIKVVAGILSTGRYVSDNKKYVIDYLPEIVHESGKVLSTPARISNSTGRMEISKKAFSKMTIPMRMAILCHEFSHFYLNEVQRDEIEADLNALTLYLGMGYPIIEAHKAFLETFENTPTQMNKERYIYLKTFIDNFDKLKHKICSIT